MSTRVGNTITTKGNTMRSRTTTAAVLGGVFLAALGSVGVAAPASASTTAEAAPITSVRAVAGGVTTAGRVCHYVKYRQPWCFTIFPTMPANCWRTRLICD